MQRAQSMRNTSTVIDVKNVLIIKCIFLDCLHAGKEGQVCHLYRQIEEEYSFQALRWSFLKPWVVFEFSPVHSGLHCSVN